ncbi:MAG: D-alanyl-D-alanine carboxypeptidase family protein [Ruminococcaceae bacterium]|nr:D-alanyl-D-alanine carboxypeptidase family protein [Oscillospiraceae bacterium]
MKNSKRNYIILIALVAVLIIVTVIHHTAKEPISELPDDPGNSLSEKTDIPPASTPDVPEHPQVSPETVQPTPTPDPTPTPTPEPYSDKPDIDISSWEYVLVNADNNISDYVPELTVIEGSQSFDTRAVAFLEEFIAAARGEGLSVYLSSSYRSYNEQSYLYDRKVSQYGDPAVAATIVAPPGTSEHQTGLCADITDMYYASKDRSLENTALFKWMKAHCHEYGFILRYPDGKQDITGIIYEPWHFRYVGKEVASYIMENELTLEEFHELYK